MDETFSSIDFVTQCLMDEKRTKAFRAAVEALVKPGDVVLDSGTGSGILALFAARAGAKKVIAVECDPYVAALARENFERNGYADVIELVSGDIRSLALPAGMQFDVVIMEMLTTAMVDEYQVWAINNLHKNAHIKPTTTFIPHAQETKVSLVNMNFDVEGLTMRMVRHLWDPFPVNEMKEMTPRIQISSVAFDQQNETGFSWEGCLEALADGPVNSILLTSTSLLGAGIEVADTLSLNAPVVVPLPNDLSVRKGDLITCKINYQFGNGYRNFTAVAMLP